VPRVQSETEIQLQRQK